MRREETLIWIALLSPRARHCLHIFEAKEIILPIFIRRVPDLALYLELAYFRGYLVVRQAILIISHHSRSYGQSIVLRDALLDIEEIVLPRLIHIELRLTKKLHHVEASIADQEHDVNDAEHGS